MNSIKNIFSKKKNSTKKENPEPNLDVPVIEVTETAESESSREIEPILVKSMDLDNLVDVQEVGAELRDGNIVILNISPLMDEDPAELKRGVDQLKELASEIGGDVGRLSESKIIATPELVKIQFKREA